MNLNKLEKAVLEAMCTTNQEEAATLKEQIRVATVKTRENTGVGFYSKLEVHGQCQKVNATVISNVFGKVEGLKNPMAFVLFIRNGIIDLLEGAATEDSTVGILFSTVEFEILLGGATGGYRDMKHNPRS